MGYLILLVGLAIVVLALGEVIILASRFSNLGAGLILAIFLWEAFVLVLPMTRFGRVNAYPQDLVFIVLAVAGIARFLTRKKFAGVHLAWFLFGLSMLASFTRGAASYGFQAAGVELREFFYFFAAALYFMSFPINSNHLKRLTQMWLYVAAVLILLALFRWATGGYGLDAAQQLTDTEHGGMRVLNAQQALFLAQAFLISLFLRLVPESSRLWRNFAAVLLPVLVLLQHRTVWVVTIVSTLLAALNGGKIRSRVVGMVMVAAMAGTMLGLALFGGSTDKVEGALGASTIEPISIQQSTFAWRVEGWKELIAESKKFGFSEFMFGKPFGAGYSRKVWGSEVNYTPHNFYIQVFLRLGILGLIALIYIYAVLIRWLIQPNNQEFGKYFSGRLTYILLITQLMFFITYSPHYEQGILLGLASAVAICRRAEVNNIQAGVTQWARQPA